VEAQAMPDVELFLSVAEIAGVFVGFGALIALRSSATASSSEVLFVGMVVLTGVQAVAIALTPVALGQFDGARDWLWAASGVTALAVYWGGQLASVRVSPDRRSFVAAAPRGLRGPYEIIGALFWLPMNVALILVVLGVPPGQEAALYFGAVVLLLLFDAVMVLAVATTGAPPWRAPTGSGDGSPE
jgi:hypothetical protein